MAEQTFLLIRIPYSQMERRMPNARRGIFPAPEKWVHAIPAVVFFCFFILWWFSHSVSVDINNGQILAIHHMGKKSLAVLAARNETRLDVAILASSVVSPASDSVSGNQNLTLLNATEPVKARPPSDKS